MLNLQTSTTTSQSYASKQNARFTSSKSNVRAIKQRWNDTYNNLSATQQSAVDHALASVAYEFRRRNPELKSWQDLRKLLAKAHSANMKDCYIDTTMQRQLNISWVFELLNKFAATKVIPIHVYQPDSNVEEYHAWDGQHTLVVLWLIATQVFGEKIENIDIPVNVYSSHLKNQMRENFIDLNSEAGKKSLDLFDKWEQMVFAVRIDNASNPLWRQAEEKQTILESHGLFATKKSLNDYDEPGAISRMQEIVKLSPRMLESVCTYLVAVGAQNRPVEEKEMVLISYFFERCHHAGINVTQTYIYDIANVVKNHWNAEFDPSSIFWAKVFQAYENWHFAHGGIRSPRPKKEPVHGYPFLIEQFKKDLPKYKFPENRTTSEFVPDVGDLF